MARTIYLLSPANAGGKRAAMLMSPGAGFDLAVRLRDRGATIGEVFTFLSGLYFRGKFAYATAMARREDVLVITTDRGIVPHDTLMARTDLLSMAAVPIGVDEPRYLGPLVRDAQRVLARCTGDEARVVLLGSIATSKYVSPLLDVLGDRLHFPAEFVGRGDMSRGGLMLRHADERRPLRYVPVRGGPRHGLRPEKLRPRHDGAG